jgi:hypothetical protein
MGRRELGAEMRRRELLLGVGAAAAWPLRQPHSGPDRLRRIGFLRVGSPPPAFIGDFQKGLREQGLVEGQHFVIDYVIVQNSTQVFQSCHQTRDRKVDVIVASGTPSVLPARDAALCVCKPSALRSEHLSRWVPRN